MRTRNIVLVSVAAFILSSETWTLNARQGIDGSQLATAKQLLSDVGGERRSAFDVARSIPVAQRGPELRAALIGLLERQNAIAQDANVRGLPLDALEDPEFISAVQRTVAEMRDPITIPALAGALGMFTLIRPLAEFGEMAIPAVVEVVSAPSSRYSAVDDGLRVLRSIVERANGVLSDQSRFLLRNAARARLSGEQKFTTLWYAIDLAAIVGDADMIQTLRSLATDSGEIVARGVRTPRLVEQTQKRAADRLGLRP